MLSILVIGCWPSSHGHGDRWCVLQCYGFYICCLLPLGVTGWGALDLDLARMVAWLQQKCLSGVKGLRDVAACCPRRRGCQQVLSCRNKGSWMKWVGSGSRRDITGEVGNPVSRAGHRPLQVSQSRLLVFHLPGGAKAVTSNAFWGLLLCCWVEKKLMLASKVMSGMSFTRGITLPYWNSCNDRLNVKLCGNTWRE